LKMLEKILENDKNVKYVMIYQKKGGAGGGGLGNENKEKCY